MRAATSDYQTVVHSELRVPVTDGDIARILHLRESKSLLKKRLDELEQNLERAEFDIIKRIESGVPVKAINHINVRSTERHFPKWKEAFISAMGIKAAEKVLANTKPQVYKTLVIGD